MLSSASDKAKLFAKNFPKNSNLVDLVISLPVFRSINKLKFHISVTPKMVKKVITNPLVISSFVPVFEDCVHYIFATLFFMSKREHL